MPQIFSRYGQTKEIALLSGSLSVSTALLSANAGFGYDIEVFNNGGETVYMETAIGSAVAVVAGVASADGPGGRAVATKATIYMRVPPGITHIAAVATASAAKSVFVTPGVVG